MPQSLQSASQTGGYFENSTSRPGPVTRLPYVFLSISIVACLIGTAGNSLVIQVYRTKKARTSTGTLVMWLAILDLAASLVVVPVIPVMSLLLSSPQFFIFTISIMRIYQYVPFFLLLASTLLLVGISSERFLVICYPTKFHTDVIRRGKVWISASIFISMVIVILVNFYLHVFVVIP